MIWLDKCLYTYLHNFPQHQPHIINGLWQRKPDVSVKYLLRKIHHSQWKKIIATLLQSWALGKRPVDTIANGSRINTCQHFHIGTLISHSQIPFMLNNSCISRNSWEEIIFWCDCTVRNMCVAFTSVCQNVRCLY